MNPTLMNTTDIIAYLGISRSKFMRLRRDNKFALPVKVGKAGEFFWLKDDVDAFKARAPR